VTLIVTANVGSIVATLGSLLLRREKLKKQKFNRSLAETKCGCYLTLIVTANVGSIVATLGSLLLRREKLKKQKFNRSLAETKCGRYLVQNSGDNNSGH
jgi:hypothetical protein